jgi:hypothetical protein
VNPWTIRIATSAWPDRDPDAPAPTADVGPASSSTWVRFDHTDGRTTGWAPCLIASVHRANQVARDWSTPATAWLVLTGTFFPARLDP